MAVTIVYVGPSLDGVEIAETGQHAPQGKPVDVETGVAERLLEQDVFVRPNNKPSNTDAKKEG